MIAFKKCKNRLAIALTGIALSGCIAEAQTKKVARIGWLSAHHGPRIFPPFTRALRALGWVEGENIIIETRFAREQYDELPRLAAELVQLKVDVIVLASSVAIPAAKQATKTIPIVMGVVSDPVALGYVDSLARPGGNITGVSNRTPLNGKRLEILKESVPTVRRVAVVDASGGWKAERVSRALGVEVHELRLEHPGNLPSILKTVHLSGANGLLVLSSPQINFQRNRVVEFASNHRLPAIYAQSSFVHAGGLMSYGPSLRVMFTRAAYYVDKILKGANPSDLPVERTLAVEFVINLKAAKEIAVEIPPEVLQRADEVIR